MTGGDDKKELILATILQGFFDAITFLVRNNVDQREALDNMDLDADRNVLRAQIGVSIILSNQNEVRIQVIDKAYTFYQDKPTLLELLAKKKEEKYDKFMDQTKKKVDELKCN
ncbi:hypothetical protein ACS0TY_016970 [Phlomoides rotata]